MVTVLENLFHLEYGIPHLYGRWPCDAFLEVPLLCFSDDTFRRWVKGSFCSTGKGWEGH